MYSLNDKFRSEPFEIELAPDAALTVKPLTTLDAHICGFIAQAVVDGIARGIETVTQADLLIAIVREDFDPENEEHKKALYEEVYIKAMAQRHILSWRGICAAQGDEALPLSKENINALMSIPEFARIFSREMQDWGRGLELAKKDSGAASHGTSTAAPDTAEIANQKDSPAPAESRA